MNINFTFSGLYEAALQGDEKHPSLTWDKAQKKIEILEQFWSKYDKAIVGELEKVTKLSFKPLPITCYVNSKQSFSDPLTVQVFRDDEHMQSTLVHELCHVIMSQNNLGQTPAWNRLKEDFNNEPPVTQVHIVVHAIHQLVYEKLFPEQVKKIQEFSTFPTYIRSWDIVKEIGAQNVVNKYVLGIQD